MSSGDSLTLKDLANSWHRLLKTKHYYYDVIGKLDYYVNLSDHLERLLDLVKNGQYEPKKLHHITSPKSKGLLRPLNLIDLEDAIVFDSLVACIAKPLSNVLSPNVQDHKIKQDYSDFKSWYTLWNSFQTKLKTCLKENSSLITTDITSFFDSIDLIKLRSMLLEHANNCHKFYVDMIMMVLERWTYRPNYAPNPHRGIPQIDLESIRFLATFYLHEHDERMDKLGLEWLRWLDDMYIVIDDPNKAMDIVNYVNSSLRDLSLSINSAKTEILRPGEIDKALHTTEFLKCSLMAKEEKKTRNDNQRRTDAKQLLVQYYEEFYSSEHNGNWLKLLRHYYTLFKRFRDTYLFKSIPEHLKLYPSLVDRIFDYLLHLDLQDESAYIALDYLDSDDNRYDENELIALDFLLKCRANESCKSVLEFALNAFLGKGVKQYNDISRCLLVLIIAKYGTKREVNKIVKFYNESFITNYRLRRYILWTGLLVEESYDFKSMMDKALIDASGHVSRMVKFIRDLNDGRENVINTLNEHLKVESIFEPDIAYLHTSLYILIHNLLFHGNVNETIEDNIKSIMLKNEDPTIAKKLRDLYKEYCTKFKECDDYDTCGFCTGNQDDEKSKKLTH